MATAAEALSRLNWQAEIKLYILNASDVYVDFTDRFSNDRLLSINHISFIAEGKYGQPVTKSITITVDNSDRYWDESVPAAFGSFFGKNVQIRINVADASEITLATFRIPPDGITTGDSSTATIKLEPLTETMMRAEASEIKQGLQKHQYKSWLFLVKELIRSEFGDSSGDLPGTYSFPTDPRFTFPDGNKHFSAWGKPPQWDGTDWNQDNTDTPYALDYDSTNGKIYVGISEKLWEFDLATDTWTDLGEHSTNGNGVDVRSVFFCTNGVVVCKWADSATSVYSTTLYVNFYDISAAGWHATTKGSYADFFSGTWHIFNGSYQDLGVNGFHQTKGKPASTKHFGTNFVIPFEQYITADFGTNNTVSFYGVGSLNGQATLSNPVDISTNGGGDTFSPYYETIIGEENINSNFQCRVTWGNKPNIAFDRVDGTPDAYLYVGRYTSGSGKFSIRQLSITKGSAITSTEVMSSGAQTTWPIHSLTLGMNKNYIAFIEFFETIDSTGYDYSNVRYISTSSPPQFDAALFDSQNDYTAEKVFTDIIAYDDSSSGNGDIIMVALETDRVNKWPQYRIVHEPLSGPPYTNWMELAYYASPPKTSNKVKAALPVFFVDSDTGAMNKITAWTTAPERLDNGTPPLFDAPYCADFVTDTGSDPDIFGLSMPFHHPETQEVLPQGKYYLWQYSAKHTGRIELADFDGLNKFEAVSQLCEAFDHSVFVDSDGDWIVTPRAPSGTPSTTIDKQHYDAGWIGIKKKKGKDIINYIEFAPYEVTLQEMKTTLYQKSTSPYNGHILATQLDTGERRLKFRCINGGLISNGGVRFDWLAFTSTIETRLGAAYTSGTSVTLESVWDVAVGDTIRVVDSAEKTITAVNTSTKVITIDSGLSDAYPILSSARISKANENKWSSHGITLLDGAIDSSVTSVTVDDTSGISAGNYIIIDEEEMLVDSVDSTTTLTVIRGDNAAAHSDNDTVAVTIKPSGLGIWYEIGGQHITVMFDYDGTTENNIQAGDFVEFVCAGMKLEKRKGSKVIVADQTSIETNGKRKPRGTFKNRFMSPQIAEYLLDQKVTRYKDGKQVFSAVMGLNIDYTLLNTAYLKSEDIFPDEASNQLASIVKAIDIYPMKNQTIYLLEEQ